MTEVRFLTCYLVTLCLAVALALPEKQIKLEDIEKDTLKAAQQAKFEKQLQQQRQQQQQQLQQQQQQYHYPYVATSNVAFQTPTSHFQYVVPQQYIPQTQYQYFPVSDYSALTSKNLGVAYASPSNQAYQTYLSPQTASGKFQVSSHFAGFPTGQGFEVFPSNQPLVMTFASALSPLQQNQQYYQGSLQYVPTQLHHGNQFYYVPSVVDQGSAQYEYSTNLAYPAADQQYLALYQSATRGKTPGAYAQYVTDVSQSLPTSAAAYAPQQQGFGSVNAAQNQASASSYSNTESPIFVTVKAPKHLVASTGQKQQFAQSYTTTPSPQQTKYLNSPQYLAQNYNTIQSSQLYPKGSLSSGVKSTVSPPLKLSYAASSPVSGTTGSSSSHYVSSSIASSSNSVPSYQPFKALPARNYAF